ncbi:MAG: hypothetical protein KGY66_07190 [Candidatus Thermoplasmatota archaeon]|nr:hypothetical protein [Candidatus Thermoplasmatota archaeon]MBS3790685.1 hypothetical protein [Candidatus Thermoplasmatota archaeon]
MKREKPSEEELEDIYQRFGDPEIKEEEIILSTLKYQGDYPECKGEVALLIRNKGKIVGIKHQGGEKFVLPMRRVWKDEEIIKKAEREAKEKTGFEIEIKSLKEIRKVRFEFSNEELERWHFLFEAESIGGNLEPEDMEGIEEAKLLEEEWYWNNGFYIIGI